MVFKKIVCEVVDWVHVTDDRGFSLLLWTSNGSLGKY